MFAFSVVLGFSDSLVIGLLNSTQGTLKIKGEFWKNINKRLVESFGGKY